MQLMWRSGFATLLWCLCAEPRQKFHVPAAHTLRQNQHSQTRGIIQRAGDCPQCSLGSCLERTFSINDTWGSIDLLKAGNPSSFIHSANCYWVPTMCQTLIWAWMIIAKKVDEVLTFGIYIFSRRRQKVTR